MADSLLTEKEVEKVRKHTGTLMGYPAKIRSSATTFRSVINDSTISAWVTDTEVGRENKDKVLKNCEAFDAMADRIVELYQELEQLCTASEIANRAG